ncbi:hypothetical protein RCL1_001072 [Eukaryota sp. TZLM3-RCL]
MRFCIGSDHAAVEVRTFIVEILKKLGHEVVSICGPSDSSIRADYPDVAHEVVRSLRSLSPDNSLPDPTEAMGIVVCGSGIGICIAANKHTGVRCALCHDHYSAKMARLHNNANFLAIGARNTGLDVIQEIVETFISTSFEGGRHTGRVEKIMSYQSA